MKTKTISVLCATLLASLAANAADPIDNYKYNPYYSKVGTTVFVSGHFKHWLGKLWPQGWDPKPTEERVDRLVLVNATSERQEQTGAAYDLIRKMRNRGVSTVVIGRCDLFCARLFIGGKNRNFGQDLPGAPAFLDLQAPIDYDTKRLETKFAGSQFSAFETHLPSVSPYKNAFYNAFENSGLDGGWRLGGDGTSTFCESWITKRGCENYSKSSALDVGLITSTERFQIELPPRFPAPIATGFAKVDDVGAVPIGEVGRERYAALLTKPGVKVFSISQDGKSFGSAWGGNNTAALSLSICESKSSNPCRLYLSDEGVVW